MAWKTVANLGMPVTRRPSAHVRSIKGPMLVQFSCQTRMEFPSPTLQQRNGLATSRIFRIDFQIQLPKVIDGISQKTRSLMRFIEIQETHSEPSLVNRKPYEFQEKMQFHAECFFNPRPPQFLGSIYFYYILFF